MSKDLPLVCLVMERKVDGREAADASLNPAQRALKSMETVHKSRLVVRQKVAVVGDAAVGKTALVSTKICSLLLLIIAILSAAVAHGEDHDDASTAAATAAAAAIETAAALPAYGWNKPQRAAIGLIVKLLSTFHAKGSFINTSGQQVLVDDSLLSKRGSAE